MKEFIDLSLGNQFQDQPDIPMVLNELLIGKIIEEHPSAHKSFMEVIEHEGSERTFYRRIATLANQMPTLYPQVFSHIQQDQKLRMKKDGVLVLDEHILPHTSKNIEGVGSFYSTEKKGVELGLSMLMVYYYCNGVEYPVEMNFYRKQEELQLKGIKNQFQEKNPLAMQLITKVLQNPNTPKNIVMDSFFMTKNNIKLLNPYNIRYVSRPKRSWNCTYDHHKQNLTEMYLSIPLSEFEQTEVKNGKTKKKKRYLTAIRDVFFAGIGTQRVIFINHDIAPEASDDWDSRDPCEETESGRRFRVFVSNAMDWDAQAILELYALRWTIETSFREMSQNLALHGCKWQTLSGQYCFIALTFLCYLFLMWAKLHGALKPFGVEKKGIGKLKEGFSHYCDEDFGVWLSQIKAQCETCPAANITYQLLYTREPKEI